MSYKKYRFLFLLVIGLVTVFSTYAFGEGEEVTLLLNSHFVKTHEAELTRQAEEWAKMKGVKVRLDFITDWDIEGKVTAEAQAGAGHDIVAIRDYVAYIFKDVLIDVTSLVEELQKENGEVLGLGKVSNFIDDVWRAAPWYHQSFPLIYRKDYVEEVGFSTDTMTQLNTDNFMDLAKKLNETGHQVGFPISMCPDANACMAPFLWGFGGNLFGKNNEITIVSDGTKNALNYLLELSKYMPQEVTAWDNSGNNLFMLSGIGGVSANPPSVYATALQSNLDFADQIIHAPFPGGPEGRYRCTGQFNFGIPIYSKNKELAVDLIKYLMKKDNFALLVKASEGYDQPQYFGYQDNPFWKEKPTLSAYEPAVETLFPIGWPGVEALPSKASVRAQLLYTLPIMVSKVVTGEANVDETMKWAEEELKRLVAEEQE